jgi:uncharacterized protein (TIGR03086 family)
LAAPAELIAEIGPRQWDLPTPCPRWSVRALVGHLIDGHHTIAARTGGSSSPTPEPVVPHQSTAPGKALAHVYRDAADAVIDALAHDDALQRPITLRLVPRPGIPPRSPSTDPDGRTLIGPVSRLIALHLQIVEALVHGWDLAQATGQPAVFPEDLAEQSLAFIIGQLMTHPGARSLFGAPRAVGAYAPAIDRLVACLGRDPSSPARQAPPK